MNGSSADTYSAYPSSSLVATSAFLFMSSGNSKYKTLNDAISAAKASPNTVTYGTAGAGTFAGLAMVLLEKEGGFDMKEVPYKGATPAITDLLGGHIDLAAAHGADSRRLVRHVQARDAQGRLGLQRRDEALRGGGAREVGEPEMDAD